MRTLLVILLLLFSIQVYAQPHAEIKDTLTRAELQRLEANEPPNTYMSYHLAKKASKGSDAQKVEELLQHVSPYYLMRMGLTPDNVDEHITQFKLSDDYAQQYRQRFITAYENRNETYRQFEEMLTRDQEVRNMYNKCGDAATCRKLGDKMRAVDSVNFAYLYNYVTEHGWPSFEDGGMYVEVIAIHDHGRHEEYLPIVKNAVANGLASKGTYDLIYYWLKGSIRSTKEWLDTVPKLSFKVNAMMSGTPITADINEIINFVQAYCPIKYVFVIECKDEEVWDDVVSRFHAETGSDKLTIINRFNNVVEPYCEKVFKDCSTFCWTLHWFRTENIEPRMTLHLVPMDMKKN